MKQTFVVMAAVIAILSACTKSAVIPVAKEELPKTDTVKLPSEPEYQIPDMPDKSSNLELQKVFSIMDSLIKGPGKRKQFTPYSNFPEGAGMTCIVFDSAYKWWSATNLKINDKVITSVWWDRRMEQNDSSCLWSNNQLSFNDGSERTFTTIYECSKLFGIARNLLTIYHNGELIYAGWYYIVDPIDLNVSFELKIEFTD